jgi:antitoxin component YwqK of YwqJK toxin-antitoxin module
VKYLFSILLLLVCSSSFAQVQRAFITKEGRYSNNPQGAVSYILIRKLDSDSAYSVKQYDMRDTIMISGTYKDELLTVPNGKFIYYYKARFPAKKDLQAQKQQEINIKGIDTNNYVQMTGYFLNGKREGVWVTFSSRGVIGQRSTYENDKMNGPFSIYTGGELGYRSEGSMVDNIMEGKYYVYNADSLLLVESDYLHDKEVKQTVHLVEASESDKFHSYMQIALEKFKPQLSVKVPEIKYVVTKTGALRDIQIVKGVAPDVDAALLAALAKAPRFTPGLYDGVVFDEKITRLLLVFNDFVNGPDGQQPLPRQVHYKERLEGLIPQPQAGGTYKPGVNYLH